MLPAALPSNNPVSIMNRIMRDSVKQAYLVSFTQQVISVKAMQACAYVKKGTSLESQLTTMQPRLLITAAYELRLL